MLIEYELDCYGIVDFSLIVNFGIVHFFMCTLYVPIWLSQRTLHIIREKTDFPAQPFLQWGKWTGKYFPMKKDLYNTDIAFDFKGFTRCLSHGWKFNTKREGGVNEMYRIARMKFDIKFSIRCFGNSTQCACALFNLDQTFWSQKLPFLITMM